MKVQLGGLRAHVDLPESAVEVGRKLTSLGFALDGLEGDGDDAVLELDVGSNRPDALSHVGIARELAVAHGRALRMPEPRLAEAVTFAGEVATVRVEASDLCPRYAARVVTGLRVVESAPWMAARLLACGIRPINAIVDVTNFVLLELGHPLHAFDLDRMQDRTVVVRRAREQERMTTLDGIERALDPAMLVIADAAVPVALAGVMGGADSEIREATRDVLIESALFDPKSIRRTSRQLGLLTEASYRFERGADREVVLLALDRAAELIAQLCGGEVLAGAIDVHAKPAERARITLRAKRLELLSGLSVPASDVERILLGLGFDVRRTAGDAWSVGAPARRLDVQHEVDLIEEVARHVGFDRIPATLPPFREGAQPKSEREKSHAAQRNALAANGYHQAVNLTFDDPGAIATWATSLISDAPGRLIELENPIAENLAVMRTSLMPGLLRSASLAARFGEEDVLLFEQGPIFLAWKQQDPPAEERMALAMIATGQVRPKHAVHAAPPADILAIKGALLDALTAAGVEPSRVDVRAAVVANCAPGAAEVFIDGHRAGWLGRVHPSLLEPLEIRASLVAAELDLEHARPDSEVGRRTRVAPPRFPNMVRDLSVLVDRNLAYGAILAVIRGLREEGEKGTDGALLESFTLVDRYLGAGVPDDKVSLTFSLTYRRPDRTLTQDEVDRRHAQVVEILGREVGATLR